MRHLASTIIGTLAGGAIGLCLLFLPVERTPFVILIPVNAISTFLRRVLMPNSDPMAAFVIAIPVMILYCAIIGGVFGFTIQVIFAFFNNISKNANSE